MFEIDYSMCLPEYGVLTLDALDADEAEQKAVHKLQNDYPDATDIVIELVKEVK